MKTFDVALESSYAQCLEGRTGGESYGASVRWGEEVTSRHDAKGEDFRHTDGLQVDSGGDICLAHDRSHVSFPMQQRI